MQAVAPLMSNGATGGISDSKFVGISNSFQDISNLEIREEPKSVSLQYALVKDSASIVVDKINCSLTVSSTGDIISFGDAGNIYIKSLGGSRQKVYTHSTGYAILGCIEYDQYIYRATLDKLHRTDLTSISTAVSTGTLTPTDLDWQTLNGITYSNGLQTSYILDQSTKSKVGERIYAKKNYSLTTVGVSSGTTAPTKAYLEQFVFTPSIAGNSLRLYTTDKIDPITGSPVRTERQPAGNVDKNWINSKTSIEGDVLVAIPQYDDLYLSTNNGVNWTQKSIGTGVQLIDTVNGTASGSLSGGPTSIGIKFKAHRNCKLKSAGYSTLYSEAGAILATGGAIVDYQLVKDTTYRLEYVSGIGFYSIQSINSQTNNNIEVTGLSSGGADTSIGGRSTLTVETANDISSPEAIVVSNSGDSMLAYQNPGRLFLSINTGTTWAETQPAGSNNLAWKIIGISGDGTKYISGVYGGRLYTSSNGTSWTERQPAGNADKNRVSGYINYDGTKIIAATTGTRIRYSADSGVNWSEIRPAGDTDQNWTGVSMSNNGQTIIVSLGAVLYFSYDYGATFSNYNFTDTISSCQTNYNGDIFTVSTSKRCYQSVDGGTTRTQLQPAGNNDKIWRNLSIGLSSTPIQTVDVTAGVATFSSSLTAGNYYNILFDKEGSSWDASYKATSYPVVKTDINYVKGLIPYADTTKSRVITNIGSTVVNDIAHPMLTSNGTLYIGDGQYVATIDPAGVYLGNVLTLAEMDKIYDMTYNNAYIRIYCIQGTNTDVGIAYFWDGIQEAPDQRQELPGKFRNVAMRDNIDYTIMGSVDPILYFYPYQRQLLKRINNLSSGIKSMINYKNYLLFGAKGGVYSWGNFNKDYPECLNLEYKTSNNNNTDEIGCIWNANGDLYVSWKDGSNYGVDKLSTTVYTTTGYIITKVYYGKQMWRRKDNTECYISHEPLIAGQKIEVYTQKNLAGGFTLQYTIDDTNGTGTENNFLLQEEYNEIEFKLLLTGPGTSTPIVNEFILRHNEESEQ